MSGLAAMRAVRAGQDWQNAMDQTLDRIDDTLEDWDQWDGHSADAARWAEGEWIDARKPGLTNPANWVADYDAAHPRPSSLVHALLSYPHHVIVDTDPATQQVRITVTPETRPFVEAMEHAARHAARIYGVPLKTLGLDETAQSPRSMAAAERTRSSQWRAGSRRTKRQARSNRKGTKS